MGKILYEHINIFINNIARELEEPHDQWFADFGFPMFATTAKEYHEQVYFQSYLESYVRKMINSILKDIAFEAADHKLEFPELESKDIYNGYTNREIEKTFNYEIIDIDQRIGYLYTDPGLEIVEELLHKGDVSFITIVKWENKDYLIGSYYDDKRVKITLLWDLFLELFDEDEEVLTSMYNLFTEKISKAVDQAISMISLKTIPGFTPSYVAKNQSEIVRNLRKEICSLTSFYVTDIKYKHVENDSKMLIQQYQLSQCFFREKRWMAFSGASDFAKSYQTSEYLFRYFKNNPMFDYTPIVSGYLKSIEQILYGICAKHKRMHSINDNIQLTSLGGYEKYIRAYNMMRQGATNANDIIADCLERYRKESRNQLFHKDYFNKWERVEKIRHNTLFLYMALLGGVDPSLLDRSTLCILDDRYDRLFRLIDAQKNEHYTIIIQNKEYKGMRKKSRDKGLTYNNFGHILNTISFTQFVYDHNEELEISRFKMPTEIWTSDVFGKKKQKIWCASS